MIRTRNTLRIKNTALGRQSKCLDIQNVTHTYKLSLWPIPTLVIKQPFIRQYPILVDEMFVFYQGRERFTAGKLFCIWYPLRRWGQHGVANQLGLISMKSRKTSLCLSSTCVRFRISNHRRLGEALLLSVCLAFLSFSYPVYLWMLTVAPLLILLLLIARERRNQKCAHRRRSLKARVRFSFLAKICQIFNKFQTGGILIVSYFVCHLCTSWSNVLHLTDESLVSCLVDLGLDQNAGNWEASSLSLCFNEKLRKTHREANCRKARQLGGYREKLGTTE